MPLLESNRFNDVDRCSVLITGDTALVGVDIKNNIKGNLTTELKRRIETRVKIL